LRINIGSLVLVFIAVTLLGILIVVGMNFEESGISVTEPARDDEINVSESPKMTSVKITTVFDNFASNDALTTGWGFSCVVEANGKTILFDTGGDGNILLSNMNKLGIDPKEIDIIFLSHNHGDHTGGLAALLARNSDVTVYIPKYFPDTARELIASKGAKYVDILEPVEITPGIHSTGEMKGRVNEQAMIVDTGDGFVLINGCAHPVIVDVINRAKEIVDGDILLVMGGFHLKDMNDAQLRSIIDAFRDAGVKSVAPSHCSGDRCRELFKKEYGESYIDNGLGNVIEI
jgi:7,8-dihydropterin-6-yl-methyl-4-(beta-D-ribofuranosyl)aminobenzene 5'-phosphate synthase